MSVIINIISIVVVVVVVVVVEVLSELPLLFQRPTKGLEIVPFHTSPQNFGIRYPLH